MSGLNETPEGKSFTSPGLLPDLPKARSPSQVSAAQHSTRQAQFVTGRVATEYRLKQKLTDFVSWKERRGIKKVLEQQQKNLKYLGFLTRAQQQCSSSPGRPEY